MHGSRCGRFRGGAKPRLFPTLPKLAAAAAIAVFLAFSPSPYCAAKDYFLTIGGGYSPEGNQASLEANVLFLNQLFARGPYRPAQHNVLFANGQTGSPDMQALAPRRQNSEAIQFFADLFEYELQRVIYRSHRVPLVRGRNHAADVERAIDDLSKKLTDQDRLFIYVTAHGGRGERENEFDTCIHGWDDSEIRVHELSTWLDRLPSSTPVVMVMTQCYAGGFAHSIFNQGDKENGLAEPVRCGFFGQRHDLMAAGCRNDIEDDQEYSSYFWGAFLGKTRSGVALKNVDINRDGAISLAEAHACALLHCNTIDVPVRATESFLRVYSRTSTDDADEEVGLPPFSGILQVWADKAPADQRAVILGLAEELAIPRTADVNEVVAGERSQVGNYRNARRGRRTERRKLDEAREKLQEQVTQKWPELEDVEEPASCKLLTSDASAFLKEVKELPGYEEFAKALSVKEERDALRLKEEIRWVKYRRLLQAVRTVELAQNLPLVAEPTVVAHYQKMLAQEESFLNPPAGKSGAVKSIPQNKRVAEPNPARGRATSTDL